MRDVARRGPDVFSELARLELGEPIREKSLLDVLENTDSRTILGLLFIIGRYKDQLPSELVATLNGKLRKITSFGDSTPLATVAEALTTTRYKRNTDAIKEARKWLKNFAQRGFDWLSAIDDTILGLTALIEGVDELSELATIVLDKLLFSLALHSTDFESDARLSPLSP